MKRMIKIRALLRLVPFLKDIRNYIMLLKRFFMQNLLRGAADLLAVPDIL